MQHAAKYPIDDSRLGAMIAGPVRFAGRRFDAREIRQIADLILRHNAADSFVPIDARRFTSNVLQYARDWALIDRRKNGRFYCESRPGRYFDAIQGDAPIEALWLIFREHIFGTEKSRGFGISAEPGWTKLNLYPRDFHGHGSRDINAMIDLMIKFQQHHYCYAQFAGDIWRIELREK